MYLQHFNFTDQPFSIAPNPRYVYLSPQHREALAHLLYGISVGGGFVVLTGEVGTGKTTLCRCLLEQLPEDVDIALIFNPRLNARELLASICDELNIANPGEKGSIKRLIDVLNHHLLDAHARGRRTIVLIDEAQNLSFDVLEQIRLLTNLETNETKLLQIILVGQPELQSLLARKNLRQLSQRINARFHLHPLSASETLVYINHRLAISGVSRPVFSRRAVSRIYRLSGGIPRLINLICDRALLGAYTLGKTTVSAAIVGKAAKEVLPSPDRSSSKNRLAALVGIGLLALAVGYYLSPLALPFLHTAEKTIPAPKVQIAKPIEESGRPELTKSAGLQPQQVQVPADKKTGPELADDFDRLIIDPSLTKAFALGRLYALWGTELPTGVSDGCEIASQHGLQCQSLHSDEAGLVSLNRPAVLELTLPDGSKRYATLIGLESEQWVLDLGNVTRRVDPARLLPLWKGNFVLLWTPPKNFSSIIKPGQRDETIAMIRQQLNEPTMAGFESYLDDKLKKRIKDFQRQHGLAADGQLGPMTLIHLENASAHYAGLRLNKAHD